MQSDHNQQQTTLTVNTLSGFHCNIKTRERQPSEPKLKKIMWSKKILFLEGHSFNYVAPCCEVLLVYNMYKFYVES